MTRAQKRTTDAEKLSIFAADEKEEILRNCEGEMVADRLGKSQWNV